MNGFGSGPGWAHDGGLAWAEGHGPAAGSEMPGLYSSSSPVTGSHHGRFLCPDASGLLRRHWLSHALHRSLDHCSDHLPGGPASLRFCGQ